MNVEIRFWRWQRGNVYLARYLFNTLVMLLLFVAPSAACAEDGYDLWLRFKPVEQHYLNTYRAEATMLVGNITSPTLAAARNELTRGLEGQLARKIPLSNSVRKNGAILFGTPASSSVVARLPLPTTQLGDEGYLIRSVTINGRRTTVIAANRDVGVLLWRFCVPAIDSDATGVGKFEHSVRSQTETPHNGPLGQSRSEY